MANQPDVWSKLGQSGNPIPGNASVLRGVVSDFRFLGETASEVSAGLDAMLRSAASGGFEGQAADALRGEISGRLKAFVDNVAQAFSIAQNAVSAYLTVLEGAQQTVSSAASQADTLPTGSTQLPGLTQSVSNVQGDVMAAAKTMENALAEASKMVSEPIKVYHGLAKLWHDIKKGWDAFKKYFWEALEWFALAMALLSVLVDGPAGIVAFLAGAAIMIHTAVEYAQGKASLTELLTSFLGVIAPETRGLIGVRSLGAGLRGIAQGVRNMGSMLSIERLADLPALIIAGGDRLLDAGGTVWNMATRLPGALLQGARAIPGFLRSVPTWTMERLAAGKQWLVDDFTATTGRVTSMPARLALYTAGMGGRLLTSVFTPLVFHEITELGFVGAARLALVDRGLLGGLRSGDKLADLGRSGGDLGGLLGGTHDGRPDLLSVGGPDTLLLPGSLEWHLTVQDLVEPPPGRLNSFAFDSRTGRLTEYLPTPAGGRQPLVLAPTRDSLIEPVVTRPADLDTETDLGTVGRTNLDTEPGNAGEIRTPRDTSATTESLDPPILELAGLPTGLTDTRVELTSALFQSGSTLLDRQTDLDAELGLVRTNEGLLAPLEPLLSPGTRDLVEGLGPAGIDAALRGEIEVVPTGPDEFTIRIGDLSESGPVDDALLETVRDGGALRTGLTSPVLNSERLDVTPEALDLGAADALETLRAAGNPEPAEVERIDTLSTPVTRFDPAETLEMLSGDVAGFDETRVALDTEPTLDRVAMPPATPVGIGAVPPLSMFEAITGGVGGALGTERLRSWVAYQNVRATLDVRAARLDDLTGDVTPSQVRLEDAYSDLVTNGATANLDKLGMSPELIESRIETVQTQVFLERGLPSPSESFAFHPAENLPVITGFRPEGLTGDPLAEVHFGPDGLGFRTVGLPGANLRLAFDGPSGIGRELHIIGPDGTDLTGTVGAEFAYGTGGDLTVRMPSPVNPALLPATWRFDADGQLRAADIPLSGEELGSLSGTAMRVTFQPRGTFTDVDLSVVDDGGRLSDWRVEQLPETLADRIDDGFTIVGRTGPASAAFHFGGDGRLQFTDLPSMAGGIQRSDVSTGERVDLGTGRLVAIRPDAVGAPTDTVRVPDAPALVQLDDALRPSDLTVPAGFELSAIPEESISDVRLTVPGLGGSQLRLQAIMPAYGGDLSTAHIAVLDSHGSPVGEQAFAFRGDGGLTVTAPTGAIRWNLTPGLDVASRDIRLPGTDRFVRFDLTGAELPRVVDMAGLDVTRGVTIEHTLSDLNGFDGLTVRVPNAAGTEGALFRFDADGLLAESRLPLTGPVPTVLRDLAVHVVRTPAIDIAPALRGAELVDVTGHDFQALDTADLPGAARFDVETLDDGRLLVQPAMPSPSGDQPTRTIIDPDTGRVLETTLTIPNLRGGEPLGDLWRIDATTGVATRLDSAGLPLAGPADTARLHLLTDGGFRLVGFDDRVVLEQPHLLAGARVETSAVLTAPVDRLALAGARGLPGGAGGFGTGWHIDEAQRVIRTEVRLTGEALPEPLRQLAVSIERPIDGGLPSFGFTESSDSDVARFFAPSAVPSALAERLSDGISISDITTGERFHTDEFGNLVYRDHALDDNPAHRVYVTARGDFAFRTLDLPGTNIALRFDTPSGFDGIWRLVGPDAPAIHTVEYLRGPADSLTVRLSLPGQDGTTNEWRFGGNGFELSTDGLEVATDSFAAPAGHLDIGAPRMPDAPTTVDLTNIGADGSGAVHLSEADGTSADGLSAPRLPGEHIDAPAMSGERLDILTRNVPDVTVTGHLTGADVEGLGSLHLPEPEGTLTADTSTLRLTDDRIDARIQGLEVQATRIPATETSPASVGFALKGPEDVIGALTIASVPASLRDRVPGGFVIADAGKANRWYYHADGLPVFRDLRLGLANDFGAVRFDLRDEGLLPRVVEGGVRDLAVRSIEGDRLELTPVAESRQKLESLIFDTRTRRLVEETIPIRFGSGRFTGNYWKVNHLNGEAVRIDSAGRELTGWYDHAAVEKTLTGEFKLVGRGKSVLFERDQLSSGNRLDMHLDADGRGRWTEYDPSGSVLRHGSRNWSADQRSFHDYPTDGWRPSNLGEVRTYTKAVDGGLVRAEKSADGTWTWQRFDKSGTQVLSGERQWSSWNHVAYQDLYRDPVTGRPTVAQQRRQIWPIAGFRKFDYRTYVEHPLTTDPMTGAMRTDHQLYTGINPANAETLRAEKLADGSLLKRARLSEMRPPAFFWKARAGSSWTDGFFRNLVTGDSVLRVHRWTETTPAGHVVRGVRLQGHDGSWRDIDEYGRLVRAKRVIEDGRTIEIGRAPENPSTWAPVPSTAPGTAYQLLWRDTAANGLSGTRFVDAQGRWQDVFTDEQGSERLLMRSQGDAVREYLHEHPLRPDTFEHTDDTGVWVDKNHQSQIIARRDHWNDVYVQGAGKPYKRTWAWHASYEHTPGQVIARGVRKQARGSAWAMPWDDSFSDYDQFGELVRERNYGTGTTTWVDTTRQPDGTYMWEKRTCTGTTHSTGTRVYTNTDAVAGHWTDTIDDVAVRFRHGELVRELDYTVDAPRLGRSATGSQLVRGSSSATVGDSRVALTSKAPLPAIPEGAPFAMPKPRLDSKVSDLLERSKRHFGPVVQVNPQVWKEFHLGKVFRSRTAQANGHFRETNHQWDIWREYDADGRTVAQKTISGRVWQTDAFGRFSLVKSVLERHSFPGIGAMVGRPGDRGWSQIGRENNFRGYNAEFEAFFREITHPYHQPFTTTTAEGESRYLNPWVQTLRNGSTNFSHGFVTQFVGSLGLNAANNHGKINIKTLESSLMSGAVGGVLGSGLSAIFDRTRAGAPMSALDNLDRRLGGTHAFAAKISGWTPDLSRHFDPARWRRATADHVLSVPVNALNAFVSNAINATIFPVGGTTHHGVQALEAGGMGAVGSLFSTGTFGLARTALHQTMASRLFTRGGMLDIALRGVETGLQQMAQYYVLQDLHLTPSAVYGKPPGNPSGSPATSGSPQSTAPEHYSDNPSGL